MEREGDVNNKTDLQVQNVVDKTNLQDTEVSTDIMSPSTATASNSKIIDTEMDPPSSLFVRVTTSSRISEYQLIDMSILANVFMPLSCPGCHDIQCLKLYDINPLTVNVPLT